ncbi:MAG: TIGR04283 family arsenosugar biosynthesis glycosyltransferase [Arenibacterium sp.]
MKAQISIVIPTLNAESHLADCLSALIEGLMAGLIRELIVSDGGSTDKTTLIADEAGAVLLHGPASRGGQLRKGAEVARGDWLLVLHADTVLAPGWSEEVAAHIQAERSPACFRLRFRARGMAPRLVEAWANLRTRFFGLPYGDQGLLIPRSLYEAAGGYPDQPLMEDVALVRALKRGPVLFDSEARTSAARYQKSGWLRRGGRNLWTLARYFAGADPRVLERQYRR